uniref:Uncharacterized protein n=1 Tax=Arundo donax TaxID=35708 RepID=A0A0A9G3U0_ARUDO
MHFLKKQPINLLKSVKLGSFLLQPLYFTCHLES